MINLEKNYEIIREVCTRYRKELTVFSAVMGSKWVSVIDLEEYINFMNQLPLNVFIGNQLGALYNNETINLYLRLLKLDDFIAWVKETVNPEMAGEIIPYLCN